MLNFVKGVVARLSLTGLEQAAPESRRLALSLLASDIGIWRFLAVATQLGLLLLVIHQFRIEEISGLLQITGIIFLGFVIHSWLAPRYRLPFFVLLSMLAIEAVFGATNALWLIGIGVGLIGLCHLPVAFWLRVTLVFCAGAGLATLQAGWAETSWSGIILPILGSMFMFRMIIYLYDIRHEKTPASIWERLSYFFLLPNVCFPLFPVVDYQLFRRTYYNADASEIYQNGMLWIFRGVLHLLLYRAIYYYATPPPADVQGLAEVVQFIVSSYLLYLRVSGLFHMIIGILCLFGFNLPETHHLYFFASGFNDVWRRLNIYWKDFMVKIFYYPILMRTRRWGMTPARVLATGGVFLATWLLHSYQWFWLQGTFPITATDGMYWGLLGMLVIANTLYVASQLRKPPAEETPWTWNGALVHAAKVVGMFVVMSVLWSFWSSSSVAEWTSAVAAAGQSGLGAYVALVAGVGALIAVGAGFHYLAHRRASLLSVQSDVWRFARPAAYTTAGALLLLMISIPVGQDRLGVRGASIIASLQESRLNQRDLDEMTRGYYEGLLDGDGNYTSELWWAVQARKPRDWKPLYETDAVRSGDGVFDYELRTSYDGIQKQEIFRTNQWGMRDKEYTKEKPAGTYRIALLGASIEMGAGVKGSETYEAILEDRLNREDVGDEHSRFEILNFSVGAYSVVQNAAMLEERVFSFGPDIVFYAVGSNEDQRLLMQLANLIKQNRPIPSRKLNQIIQQSGAHSDRDKAENRRRLEPFADEIIRWGLEAFSAACEKRDIVPVLVYVPNTDEVDELDSERSAKLLRTAREAGYSILNLDGVYAGHDVEAIRLAPWDWHLSVEGHRLVADRLYRLLREHDSLLDPTVTGPERMASATS